MPVTDSLVYFHITVTKLEEDLLGPMVLRGFGTAWWLGMTEQRCSVLVTTRGQVLPVLSAGVSPLDAVPNVIPP